MAAPDGEIDAPPAFLEVAPNDLEAQNMRLAGGWDKQRPRAPLPLRAVNVRQPANRRLQPVRGGRHAEEVAVVGRPQVAETARRGREQIFKDLVGGRPERDRSLDVDPEIAVGTHGERGEFSHVDRSKYMRPLGVGLSVPSAGAMKPNGFPLKDRGDVLDQRPDEILRAPGLAELAPAADRISGVFDSARLCFGTQTTVGRGALHMKLEIGHQRPL